MGGVLNLTELVGTVFLDFLSELAKERVLDGGREMNNKPVPTIPGRQPIPVKQQSLIPESVDLRMTAKGLYYWDISLKGNLVDEQTVTRLVGIDHALRVAFPKNVTILSKGTFIRESKEVNSLEAKVKKAFPEIETKEIPNRTKWKPVT